MDYMGYNLHHTHLNLCSKGERGCGSPLAEGESNGRGEGGGVDVLLRLVFSLHAVVGTGALPSHLATNLQGRTASHSSSATRERPGRLGSGTEAD